MKSLIAKNAWFGLLIISVVTLSACNSGGGSGGSSGFTTPNINETPLAISVANQSDVATSATEGLNGTSDSGGFVLGAVSNKDSESRFNVFDFSSSKLLNYANRGTAGTNYTAGVTGSDTIPCDSGKIVISYNINDPSSDTLVVGDSVSITAKKCVDNFDGTTVSGKYSMTVTAGYVDMTCDFGFGMNCPDVTLAVSFNNFQVSETGNTATIHGGFSMSVSELNGTSSFNGTSLYLVSGSDAVHLTNFDVSTEELSATVTSTVANLTLASTFINGSITIETTDPVLQDVNDLHPYQGTIVVTGEGGATLTIVYLDATQAELTLDTDGPGGATPPNSPVTITW